MTNFNHGRTLIKPDALSSVEPNLRLKSLRLGLLGKSAILLSVILLNASFAQAELVDVPDAQLTMNEELREDVDKTLYFMRYNHYVPNELNDEYSAKTLDGFLDLLDPNKVYFTQKDINRLKPYRNKLDDLLKKRDAEVAFDIFKTYRARMDQQTKSILKLIDEEFDFKQDEVIDIDSENFSWAKNNKELTKRWRKRIKNDTLQQLMAETAIDEVRQNLVRRYQRQRDVIFQLKADEVFEWFINAYAKEVGPHTQYMSHITAENFRINMSLSLEGIGAALNTDQDYTVVNRIVAGGPAERSGAIKAEDKIVGVGQDGEDMINVIGWRLTDVVQMIRGKKDTKVRLQIQKSDSAPGSPPETLELVRDVIQLEDQAAKLSQISLPNGDKESHYSVIRIPSFYSNSGSAAADTKYTATTHDVRKLLQEVNQGDSQGLIIDLRGNGGGYLNEAISLTGLFIPQGPVVQVVQKNKKRHVLKDEDKGVAYEGPVMVLIDRFSASASEIFAAALQDYGRAIVVGERSFGKGTVQRVAPLRYGNDVKHESQMKFTTAQFFRINGGSTQHKGVVPDVMLNSGAEDEEFGERGYDNALPWSKTLPASYEPNAISSELVQDLGKRHLERTNKSPAFNFLRQSSSRIAENKGIKELSLNMQTREAKRDEVEKESMQQLNDYRASLGLEAVTREEIKDNPLPGEDEHWNTVFHIEAARIMQDQLNWKGSAIVTQSELVEKAEQIQ